MSACEAFHRAASRRRDLIAQPRAGAIYNMGDQRWRISDLAPFEPDHPEWSLTHDIGSILREVHEHNGDRWAVRTG